LQAYVFLGVMIVLSSQFCNFFYLYWYAGLVPTDIIFSFGDLHEKLSNYSQTQINEILFTGQTVTFVSIVFLQVFGNLLSTRTHVKSFFSQTPWSKQTRNVWIFLAQLVSISIVLFINFNPFFHNLFEIRSIPFQFFLIPIAFSFLIFVLEEIRKLFVRKEICKFHKIGW